MPDLTDILQEFEEFGDISESALGVALTAAGAGTDIAGLAGEVIRSGNVPNFIDFALDVAGDILDPFFPGGAGSELRATSSTVSVARINAARRAAGLPPLPGGAGRSRRRVALTTGDLRIMHEIASSISKKAAETFIAQRVRR